MGEIIGNAQATPGRIFALARLIGRLGEPTRERVMDLLQPAEDGAKQDAARTTIKEAIDAGVVVQERESGKLWLSDEARQAVVSADGFRRYMASRLCGIRDVNGDNYYLNQFTAWYAVQNETALSLRSGINLAAAFNDHLYPNQDGRTINDTKLNGWRNWAAYLGWGTSYKLGTADFILPNAVVRVGDLLPMVFSTDRESLPVSEFMHRLSALAPELDDGELYQVAWEASFPATEPQYLSLMLSTALRTLHETGVIALRRDADAAELRRLYPAEGTPHRVISHVIPIRLWADGAASQGAEA
jgi:hypothetical protein